MSLKVVKQVKLTENSSIKREQIDIVTIGDDWEHKYLRRLGMDEITARQKGGLFSLYRRYAVVIKKCIIRYQSDCSGGFTA